MPLRDVGLVHLDLIVETWILVDLFDEFEPQGTSSHVLTFDVEGGHFG